MISNSFGSSSSMFYLHRDGLPRYTLTDEGSLLLGHRGCGQGGGGGAG